MTKENPSPEEQGKFVTDGRMTVQKIENGYLCKRGVKWVFCGDLQAVLGYMKVQFEPTEKQAKVL